MYETSLTCLLSLLSVTAGAATQEPIPETYTIPLRSNPWVLQQGQRPAPDARYVLTQFTRALTRAEQAALSQQGIRPLQRVARRAWICAVEDAAPSEEISAAYGIAAMGAWGPAQKIEPRLLQGDVEPWAVTPAGRWRLLVRMHADVSAAAAQRVLGTFSQVVERHDDQLWAIELMSARLPALLAEARVFQVQEGPLPASPVNDEGLELIRADEVQDIDLSVTPPLYRGRSGAGVRLAVSESVLTAHPDFFNHDSSGLPTTPRFVFPQSGSHHFHGTAVAGIIGGNGWNSVVGGGSPFEWRGVAPEATLFAGAGYGPSAGVDASNHSFIHNYGNYGLQSATTDRRIQGGVAPYFRRPHIWAVGNQGAASFYDNEEGFYSIYGLAKNPIAVGALNANDGSLANFSSLGPTFDGRIKPDVMAPGFKTYLPADRNPGDRIQMWIDYVRILDGATVDYAWEFNTPGDTEGWFATDTLEIHNVGVASGALNFEVPYVVGTAGGFGFADIAPDLVAKSTHVIEMRYAYADPLLDSWRVAPRFYWSKVGGDYVDGRIDFDTVADGNYHVVRVPVGALGRELNGSFELVSLGGWGGTIDRLRLDPMIVFDGCSTTAHYDETYTRFTGTSAAAPFVTGVVGLMLEEFRESHGTDLASDPPYPSTIKSILVQTAVDLIHDVADPRDPLNPDTLAPVLYHRGPDFATGYGKVDAAAAVELIALSATSPRIFEGTLDIGGSDTYTVEIAPGESELKVTLAWDDYEGPVGLDERVPRLVNDLDLVAVAPDGTFHYPWTLDPLPVAPCGTSGPGCGDRDPIDPAAVVPAYRAPDHRNNVEMATIDFPMAGTWHVRVFDQDIDVPSQEYSIVASHRLNPADGTSGNYCEAGDNSVSAGGGRMDSTGSFSVQANDLTLTASPVPNAPGLFIFGTEPAMSVLGDGFLCIGGSILRTPAVLASGQQASLPLDFQSPGNPENVIQPGEIYYFQYWYRDFNGAGSAGYNLSDGLLISFAP